MNKLINLLQTLILAFITALTAYFYGRKTVENERTKTENQKLKTGVNAVMRGDYSPNALRDRMRAENDHK